MIIEIKVIPGSSKEKIVRAGGVTKVYVNAAPDKGKANKAVIALIAERYEVRKSNVRIIRGETSRNKVIEVSVDE